MGVDVDESWVKALRSAVTKRGLVVFRFDDDEWDRLEESRHGLMEFTIARSRTTLAKVTTPTACLAFRRHVDDQCHGAGRQNARFGLVTSRDRVSTLESRVKIARARSIGARTTEEVCGLVTERPHERRLRERLAPGDSVVRLPSGLSAHLVEKLIEVDENRVAMRLASMGLSVPTHFSGPASTQWDAVGTALRAFGLPPSDPAVSIELARGKATELARVNVIEDGVIEHDARLVPGYDLIGSDVTGRAVFERRGERLVIYTANRRDLERVLGVDLVYLNETRQNIVMVQYKMLEAMGKDWVYRPDGQLEAEIERMRRFDSKQRKEPHDYRLNPQIFYLKFAKRARTLRNATITIPLDHYQELLSDPACRGPKGGLRISFDSLGGRYLHQGPLLDLIRSGYIGAHGATTKHLSTLVEAVVNNGRGAVAAVQASIPF